MNRERRKSGLGSGEPAGRPGLPLNPRVFAMLLALEAQPLHGYAIKQSVEAQSRGELRLDPGALYRHLSKLLDDGLVREVEPDVGVESIDSRRRTYELTAPGRALLVAEAERLEALIARARERRLLGRSRV